MTWQESLSDDLDAVLGGRCDIVDTDRLPTEGLSRSWEVAFRLQTSVLYAYLATADLLRMGRGEREAQAYRLFCEATLGVAAGLGASAAVCGEGVIAVFEPRKEPALRAALCGVRIHRLLHDRWPRLFSPEGSQPKYGFGVDYGELLAVRTGYVLQPGRSEMAWLGRPARFAAVLARRLSPPLPVGLSTRAHAALPKARQRRNSYLRELVHPLWKRESLSLQEGEGPTVYVTNWERWQ